MANVDGIYLLWSWDGYREVSWCCRGDEGGQRQCGGKFLVVAWPRPRWGQTGVGRIP